MPPKIERVFKPFGLRFSVCDGAPIYYSCADAGVQMDGIENMMGIGPEKGMLFDSNLGFLPVANTVLIRGKKNILVDPNNHHMGFYGMLSSRLKELGVSAEQIDVVVNTHCHHDHAASNSSVPDKTLVVGEGELEHAAELYWPQYVDAMFSGIMKEVRVIAEEEGMVALDDGVYAMKTPGHTPGSISVLVETDGERVAIIGDAALIREEYVDRKLSHWYSLEQMAEINRSLDKIAEWNPTLVFPGHEDPFRP